MQKKKFLWGVVNIGQQTEGSDSSSNWAKWSQRDLVPAIGQANNYWEDYKSTHDRVKETGCNSLRITIEWSRIEPTENKFDKSAINHYKKIILDLRRRNIVVVVGLWHWSVPMWFEEKYGMHHKKCPALFLKFAKYVRDELGELIDYLVILNEPSVFIWTSYINGSRPPFNKNYIRATFVLRNLIKMHKSTYTLWKNTLPQTPIGSTYLINNESGRDNSLLQNLILLVKDFLQNNYMLRRLQKYSDYIGLNYYTNNSFFFGKSCEKYGIHGTNDWHSPDVWKSFPKGLYSVLMRLRGYQKPILILENGKPTNPGVDDKDRQIFLKQSISYMHKAMQDGVDVRGYFHYSLCDSYEWDSGYDFKFGLVEVNRTTGKRQIRKSCITYKNIIKASI